MTTIELTQNMVSFLDNEDYRELSKYKWYYDRQNKCAARRDKKTKKIIRMHRQIMNPPKNLVVDHINGNGLDNRRINLRNCTQRQNVINKKIQKNNTSGFVGVCWDKQMKLWRVRVRTKLIGLFSDKYEAIIAYEKNSNIEFGEFKRRHII